LQGNWILRFPTTDGVSPSGMANASSGQVGGDYGHAARVYPRLSGLRSFHCYYEPSRQSRLDQAVNAISRTAIAPCASLDLHSLSHFLVISRLPSLNVLVKVIYSGAFSLPRCSLRLHRRIGLGPPWTGPRGGNAQSA